MGPPGVLGVDVGGTAIKAWLDAAPGGGPVAGVPTPREDPTGERTADAISRLVREAGDVAAVGLAVPGIVDDAAGVCRHSVNLGWRDVPIGRLVEDGIGRPVAVTHDVRAGAVAEWATGAGAGRDGGLLFAPVGTGLALATVDGTGVPIATGWAGEVGQLVLTTGPHAGLRVEEVASAGGLARRYGAAGALDVLRAKRAGDARAASLWAETVDALAEVLAWAIALTAPGTVVIGGGLARSGAELFEPLDAAVRARTADFFPPTPILPAQHGTDAAAVGSARLARGLLPVGAP